MCKFQMKCRILPLAAAVCLFVAGGAGADQCQWIALDQADRAYAILAELPVVLEYCEPCGDGGPGAPYAVERVDVNIPGDGYREMSVNGKVVDLAYIFVRVGPGKYGNFAMMVGCEASSVSESLTIAEKASSAETPAVASAASRGGLAAEFEPGKRRSEGVVYFYRHGGRIESAILRVFDARGNIVNRVGISDRRRSGGNNRIVGTWDLIDMSGRLVRPGEYSVTGTIVDLDTGNEERVSLTIGVR